MRNLLIILFFCISGSLFGQSLSGSGSITVSGDVRSTRGMLRQDDTWHMFGGFQDSAVTITITEDVYSHVTNAAHNLWTGIEADGITISGDTMIIANAGDYIGSFEVTFKTTNANSVLFRIFNVTDNTQQGFSTGATGRGADYATISKPLYFYGMSAGDRLVMQCTNVDASNNITVHYATYFLTYLHD